MRCIADAPVTNIRAARGESISDLFPASFCEIIFRRPKAVGDFHSYRRAVVFLFSRLRDELRDPGRVGWFSSDS